MGRSRIPFAVVFLVVLAAVGAVVAGIAVRSAQLFETTLEFRIRDRVSTRAVWNATVTLQDRFLRTYYTGAGEPLLFSRLQPGTATLEVSAPDYQPATVPITLRRGRNRIDEPSDLVGLRIPDLSHFVVHEDISGGDLHVSFWPISRQGPAVVNHPALDLWIGARISTQLSAEPTARGETQFAGEIEWSWDPSPGTLVRYRAQIPGEQIEPSGSDLFVIDYLVIVPDPLLIERDEVAAIVTAAWTDLEPAALANNLAQHADRFDFFIHTSWNLSR